MSQNIPDYRFLANDICWNSPSKDEISFSPTKEICSIVSKKPVILAPWIVVGAVFMSFNIINSILLTKINEIEPLNQEYESLVQEINGYQKANGTLRTNTDNVRNLLKESINPVEFAANLQNLIPLTVQIGNYEILNNKFNIEAMSISQKDLDQFIVLLGKHPLIVEDTIEIIELNASSNQSGGSVNESNQISSQYSISLTADIKILDISETTELTKKSGNYGLLHKLNILNKGHFE